MPFLFLSILFLLPGGNVRVKAELNQTSMTIGEVLVYSIRIEYPEKTVLLGEPAVDFRDFEITRIQEYEPEKKNGFIVKRTEYLLTTFNVDTFFIRGPVVRYLQKRDTLKTEGNPVRVIVRSVLDSTAADIRPEKPIIEGEVNWFGLIAAGGGLLILLGVVAYFLFRWYKKSLARRLSAAAHITVVVKNPENEAMEKLARLRQTNLPAKGEIKLFHIELSNIIRIFIEQISPAQAMEMPTSDLIRDLRSRGLFADAYIQTLRAFLEICDLVKFAKYPSSGSECDELYEQAANLVRDGAVCRRGQDKT